METDEANLATEDQLNEACDYVSSCDLVKRTPSIPHAQDFLNISRSDLIEEQVDPLNGVDVTLKMENLQNTGSFKIRGLVNQTRFLPKDVLAGERSVVTMSAGNYGKAYGYLLKQKGVSGVCVMPLTAPLSRVQTVQGYGIEVELVPTRDMVPVVNEYINQRGCHFMHSYDDINLITAYASIGDEIIEDDTDVDIVVVGCGGGALLSGDEIIEDDTDIDIVVVGCGGGALLSGIACRVKALRPQCKVYGVEPENACTMYESLKQQTPVTLKGVKSVASGLAPPSAGKLPYLHCKKYVDDIILVSEAQITSTVRVLFDSKIIAEAAGCASLAALLSGKIPDVTGKKVAVVLSGGNISLDEINQLMGR